MHVIMRSMKILNKERGLFSTVLGKEDIHILKKTTIILYYKIPSQVKTGHEYNHSFFFFLTQKWPFFTC